MITRTWTIGAIAAVAIVSGGLAGAVTASTGSSLGPAVGPAVGYVLRAKLDSSQMVPAPKAPVSASASGHFQALLARIPVGSRPSGGIAWRLGWRLTVSHLTGRVTKVEIGQGARGRAGSPLLKLCAPCGATLRGIVGLTAAKAKVLLANGAFVTASTATNKTGEIRGQVSRPTGAAPSGSIAGTVVRNAGPDPRSGGGNGGTVPVPGDSISAGPVGGPSVALAVSAQDGSFHMSLPPGEYTLVESICGATARASVGSGATVNVTLTVPNSC